MARSTTAPAFRELVEQARVFAHGPRPDRSIVFLAVTAEEKGLLGSEYYATHPLYSLGKTVADLNVDAWQPVGRQKNFTIRGTAKLDLVDDVIAAGKAQGRYFTPDPASGDRRLLSFGPFPLRQGRRSGDQLLAGPRPGGRRHRARRSSWRRNITPSTITSRATNGSANWDWSGVAENAELLHEVGLRARQFARMAELVGRQRISRRARRQHQSEATELRPPASPGTDQNPQKGERG